jgi:hypothetical protein
MGTDPAGDPEKNISRYEFDAAKPHLQALLDHANQECVVSLNAHGHGSFDYRAKVFTPQTISVEIKQLGLLARD